MDQLECDYGGIDYIIEGHDISLKIPKQAVPEGKKIHFEVGVAVHGPFKFPKGTQPVSPILWLRKLEDDIILKQCCQLTLPHCYTGSANKIYIAIADHSSPRDITTDVDGQICCLLEEYEMDAESCVDGNRYRMIELCMFNHIFCILKDDFIKSEDWCRDISFTLVQVDLQPSNSVQEFHFYGIFDLATYRKV